MEHYQSGAQTRRVAALAEAQPEARLQLHPAAAAAQGIADGDYVSISNERGVVSCRAELSTDIRPGDGVPAVPLPGARERQPAHRGGHGPHLRDAGVQDQQGVGPPGASGALAAASGCSRPRSSSRGDLMTERIVVVGFGPVAARLIDELLPAVRSGHRAPDGDRRRVRGGVQPRAGGGSWRRPDDAGRPGPRGRGGAGGRRRRCPAGRPRPPGGPRPAAGSC